MFNFLKIFKRDNKVTTHYAIYNFTKKTIKDLETNITLEGIYDDTKLHAIFCPVEILNNKRLSPDPILNLKPGWRII